MSKYDEAVIAGYDMRYISYRTDRDCWLVKFRDTAGRAKTKNCKDLDEAILWRDQWHNLYALEKSTLIKRRNGRRIPNFNQAMLLYIEHKSNTVKPATIQNMYSTMNLLSPYVGITHIDEIDEWQTIFEKIREEKNLSYTYLMKHVKLMKSVYSWLIEEKRIDLTKNPINKVAIRDYSARRRTKRAFTDEEKSRFLYVAYKESPFYGLMFEMFFQTGCRRSELLALEYNDIDFRNRTIHIYKTIGRGYTPEGKYFETITQPKTKGSDREIPISQTMLDKIEAHRQEEHELHLRRLNEWRWGKLKREPKEGTFVFYSPFGLYDWVTADTAGRVFKRIIQLAELPNDLTLHSTRHTFASTLLKKGVDYATVAELGGWSSAGVLMAIYAHSDTDRKQEIMKKFMFDE
jgi:integrase